MLPRTGITPDPLPDLTAAEEAYLRRMKRDLQRGRVRVVRIILSAEGGLKFSEETHFADP